jgi:hypothetical protein
LYYAISTGWQLADIGTAVGIDGIVIITFLTTFDDTVSADGKDELLTTRRNSVGGIYRSGEKK